MSVDSQHPVFPFRILAELSSFREDGWVPGREHRALISSSGVLGVSW